MGDLSRDFNRAEFKCKCGKCEQIGPDYRLVAHLQDLRNEFGAPITINSGHRCAAYNQRVGGAKASKHILGIAADITVKGMTPNQVQEHLLKKFHNRYGIGRYNTFTHFDVRDGTSRWDERK